MLSSSAIWVFIRPACAVIDCSMVNPAKLTPPLMKSVAASGTPKTRKPAPASLQRRERCNSLLRAQLTNLHTYLSTSTLPSTSQRTARRSVRCGARLQSDVSTERAKRVCNCVRGPDTEEILREPRGKRLSTRAAGNFARMAVMPVPIDLAAPNWQRHEQTHWVKRWQNGGSGAQSPTASKASGH